MKSKNVAYLLWFFLGYWGIHRFYCRKWISGFIWLFTFGLFGVGWLIDAVLTSKMVDEANGLAPAQVSANLRKEFRSLGITTAVIIGLIAIVGIGSWISEKLDKRTPEQKERDTQEEVLREYREIERSFPSMKLDGNVVSANLQWSADEMILIVPKTYGFMATRFAQQSASLSKDAFRRNAREYEGHYFVNVPVEEWNGPSKYMSSYCIAVPKSMVPDSFQQIVSQQRSPMPTGREIHEAALEGDLKRMNELLKDRPDLLESKDFEDNLTPLHCAVANGHKEVVQLLLTHKANVNVKAKGGVTPLHLAAILEDKDVAEMLLANKADVNAQDDNGLTPLHAAATGGRKAVAEVLLANKANVNAKAINGRTPLHAAAIKGDAAMAALLIANKADVNAKANDGITPLHFAAPLGHKGVVEVLLANQADVNAKDQEGRTPLRLTIQNGRTEIVQMLEKAGAKE